MAVSAQDGGRVGVQGGGRPKAPTREKPQLIADELRVLIVRGDLADGASLGREPDLVERFGVSRPSLREALRILEAEGLISVKRGVLGGVIVHRPHERMTARTAALVLQARNVPLADVFAARTLLEPLAAAAVAQLDGPDREAALTELRALVDAEEKVVGDPDEFAAAITDFHARLVALGGNQTLAIISEMLDEVMVRAVTAAGRVGDTVGSTAVRRRGIRSQRRLIELIAAGEAADAESHWRTHLHAAGKVMLGRQASTVVDLLDHY